MLPFHEPLLARLAGGGRPVVIELGHVREIGTALAAVQRHRLDLRCLRIRTTMPLSSITPEDGWWRIPLALYVPHLGSLPQLMRRLPQLHMLNLRVYLPASDAVNYRGARILASLGIESALELDQGPLEWDKLADLAIYALFGLRPRAAIAPFNDLARRYRSSERVDVSFSHFADPTAYLFLDEAGRVFLDEADRQAGKPLLADLGGLDGLAALPAFRERRYRWQRHFLSRDECACCEGWRICRGTLAHLNGDGEGCRPFCSDLLDAVEEYQARQTGRGPSVWQP
ncbi:MAG: hypothetical protein HY700_01305 [Gemmatimonadetes bacterium]|nr:hypothetical protein [Gemmatimonadota bacterium]